MTLALAKQQKPPATPQPQPRPQPMRRRNRRSEAEHDRAAQPHSAFCPDGAAGGARGRGGPGGEIRAAPHDGFGRLAFAWPAPVHYTAHLAGETLTIRFARRLDGHADEVKHALAAYIADAEIEGQGKIFVAHLKRPVAFKAFTVSDKTVVVDLTPRAAPKPVAPKAAPKTAAAKPPAEEAKAASATVRLSVVAKDNVTRVTFAWPHRVKYEFSHKGATARLSFDTVGAIDGDALAQALPALAQTLADESGKTVITLTIPAGMRLKQTRRGNAITLAASGTPAHPPAAAAAPAPAAIAASSSCNSPRRSCHRCRRSRCCNSPCCSHYRCRGSGFRGLPNPARKPLLHRRRRPCRFRKHARRAGSSPGPARQRPRRIHAGR